MAIDSRLKILALPMDIAWADPQANLQKLSELTGTLPPGIDVLVLPELFSTGFVCDSDHLGELAEQNSGMTMKAVHALASRLNCAVAGSFLARTAHKVYNRAFFVEPSGDETFYDKRHLFSLSQEHDSYTPGTVRKPVIRFRGWNISMIICYDLRFPVWCRSQHNEYDLLIVPANWPEARSYAWEHLLIARAIENQAYVVGANRSGIDDYGSYTGQTYAFDPQGKPLGDYLDRPEGAMVATLDRNALREWRKRFPVADDADFFQIT